jgi:hypothetical protein
MYTAKSDNEDVSQKFVNSIEKTVKDLYNKYKPNKQIQMTDQDLQDFNNAVDCHICDEKLGDDRVKDHDHLTGKFRGAAHNKCNINYILPKHIPVILLGTLC